MSTEKHSKTIHVPILGEGIRVARVVAVHKEVGDAVKADDALCEVETDKAVFPIESDVSGILTEWKVELEGEVKVGEELVVLEVESTGPVESKTANTAVIDPAESVPPQGGLSSEAIQQLQGIVPATIDMTCRWEAVRDARLRSKAAGGGTLSTAIMAAWSVVKAMQRHERFASYVRGGVLKHDADSFDLGIAVALPGDVLETAVIPEANTLEWEQFPESVNASLREARNGSLASKKRVALTISSLGAHNVRSAIPVVVPPSIATLFIGAPYQMPDPKSKDGEFMEVVSLVLTFDHRWVNGVGAAAFLSAVRKGIEGFDLA
jgi:pyruvate/2-oxoglutarate dehydrogenase complex dihydrolipoamide acyltransferase (E2) component